MTGKDDLWRGYPFGMFAVPREEVVALYGWSGTSERSTLAWAPPWPT